MDFSILIKHMSEDIKMCDDIYIPSKSIRDYIAENNILGMSVKKKSNNPFKSTFKINTVKSVVINPNTDKPAFAFHEDDSVVDIHICEKV